VKLELFVEVETVPAVAVIIPACPRTARAHTKLGEQALKPPKVAAVALCWVSMRVVVRRMTVSSVMRSAVFLKFPIERE
jgi:hypothetical protein